MNGRNSRSAQFRGPGQDRLATLRSAVTPWGSGRQERSGGHAAWASEYSANLGEAWALLLPILQLLYLSNVFTRICFTLIKNNFTLHKAKKNFTGDGNLIRDK